MMDRRVLFVVLGLWALPVATGRALAGEGGSVDQPPGPAVAKRKASMSLAEIATAVTQAHGRLKSLRADFRAWNIGDDPEVRQVRQTVAARRRSRYEWRLRTTPALGDDAIEIISFYDGTWFNVYYPYFHLYETSRRFASRPFTDKVRAHALFGALAWWPPDDDSEPPKVEARSLFLRQVLAEADCRVRAEQERVDARSPPGSGSPTLSGECSGSRTRVWRASFASTATR